MPDRPDVMDRLRSSNLGTTAPSPSEACRRAKRRWWPVVICFALAWAVFVIPANAHPVSMTTALVDATEEKVAVELEVMIEDLVLYYEIDHDENFRFPLDVIKGQAKEHQAFLQRHFQLRNDEGDRLEGEVVSIDFSEVDEDGVHLDDLMAYSIYYHFEFPLEAPLAHITVYQNFGGPNPIVPAEMELWAFQKGVRIESPLSLAHGSAHTIHYDWDADLEDAEQLEAVRARVRERDDEELGIGSYSAVYGYIYVTETEVRHELLIPLLTVETWIDVQREDPDRIGVGEQETVAQDLFEFLRRQNFVRINGSRVRPRLERVDFFGPGVRDFAGEVERRPLSVYNARVGVIISFPTDTPPGEIEFEWHHFTEQMPYYRPQLYGFDDQAHDVLFDPFLTGFEWEPESPHEPVELVAIGRPEPVPQLRLSVLSLLLMGGSFVAAAMAVWPGSSRRRVACLALGAALGVGAFGVRGAWQATVPHPFEPRPRLADDEAHAIFQALHENIYRAFEKHHEHRIYDALEQSVAGQLLEDLYLQIRRGLMVREQGGAVSRVSEIEIVDAERRPIEGASPGRQAFEYHCTWTVTGTVEHWGHIHTRTNQYEAVFTVEGLESGWKITEFQPLQEQRVRFQTRLRG